MGDKQDETPRPVRKRRLPFNNNIILSPSTSSQSSISYNSRAIAAAADDVESHKSGRMSPSKQMTVLEDLKEPVLFYGFGDPSTPMKEDVEEIRCAVQDLVDGIGIFRRDVSARFTVLYHKRDAETRVG